jgi:hypothetical protein
VKAIEPLLPTPVAALVAAMIGLSPVAGTCGAAQGASPSGIAPAVNPVHEPDDRVPVDPRMFPRTAGLAAVRSSASEPAVAPASASAPPPSAQSTFHVAQGERLSMAMGRFLQARGWSLEWNDSQDFVLQHGYELDLAAMGLPAAVARILAPYRLSAVLHSPQSQRVVAVGAARGRFVLEDTGEAK